MCGLIKNLAVFKLHIVGDIFDRGPRPDQIMEQLLNHHSVDIQWGNHDVVWMGAAAGSPICIATVLRTSLAYNNLEALEDGYGINLRPLALFAESEYRDCDMHHFYPRTDEARGPYHRSELIRTARMHKAIAIIMFKLECQVIDRNPDFELEGRDFLRRINYREGTVEVEGKCYPLRDDDFPTVNPEDPARLTRQEQEVMEALQRSFMESERLQRHVRFLFAKGGVYHIENGNLMFHGAVPLTESGSFAVETFEQHGYAGRALMDYCDERARRGYFAPEGSAERQSGEDFLWYLWCGKLSPLYGRDKMTTFERLFVEDPGNPYGDQESLLPACERFQDGTCHSGGVRAGPDPQPHCKRSCTGAGGQGRNSGEGGRAPDCNRWRLLPCLPRKNRHCRLYAGIQQPGDVAAAARTL